VRRQIILLTTTVVVIVSWFTYTLLSDNRPQLGLDLQGGLSVVLFPVKGSDLSTLDTAVQIIRNRVDGLGVAEPEVSRQGREISVDLPGVKDRQKALDTVGKTAELRFREVIGSLPWSASQVPTTTTAPAGSSTTVKGKRGSTTTAPSGASTTIKPATSTTKKALAARRINAKPIAAVHAQTSGASTTVAPSTTAPTGSTTTVKGGSTTTTVKNATPTDNSCQEGKRATPEKQDTAENKQVILPDFAPTTGKNKGKHEVCYVMSQTVLTGRSIDKAEARVDPQTGSWQVLVHFKNDDFVTKIAQPLVGKNVAIVLDGVVYSAPTINQGITGRDVQITGNFSQSDAKNLALTLRYGSLPVQFDKNEETVRDVSPTLGKDQLRAGIIAGLIGLGLVALYMIFFYRLLGIVVWLGLALTGMFFFSLLTWLSNSHGLTLTLAGVTGIIVSVGVTVDSYVVYFERLKDEVRTGKTVRSSLDIGFRRAFRTIVAADFVSLLGALVLYELATSSVRGFALFLFISTLLDLIIAYCFMHPFVSVLARRPALVRMKGIGIGAGLDVPEVKA
jgi:preprotein translocase subunit SecD